MCKEKTIAKLTKTLDLGAKLLILKRKALLQNFNEFFNQLIQVNCVLALGR